MSYIEFAINNMGISLYQLFPIFHKFLLIYSPRRESQRQGNCADNILKFLSLEVGIMTINAIYPAQCRCGHLFLEKYQFPKVQENGINGFVWCGFCRTRVNVYPQGATGDTQNPLPGALDRRRTAETLNHQDD